MKPILVICKLLSDTPYPHPPTHPPGHVPPAHLPAHLNQPMKPTNQPTNQPINQSINQPSIHLSKQHFELVGLCPNYRQPIKQPTSTNLYHTIIQLHALNIH